MAQIETVDCPMLQEKIDIAYCIELQMIADKEVKPTDEEEHLSDEDYEKCRKCKIRKMLDEE